MALTSFLIVIFYWGFLNLVNVDAYIVKQNLARFRQTEKLDIVYLLKLSDDAFPEILAYAESLSESSDYKKAILFKLNDELKHMKADRAYFDWQSYNLSRSRAYNLLSEREEKLQNYAEYGNIYFDLRYQGIDLPPTGKGV